MKAHHIEVVVYRPTSEAARQELAMRVASIHAEFAQRRIDSLSCPLHQKKALLDAVVADVKQRQQESPAPKPKAPTSRERER